MKIYQTPFVPGRTFTPSGAAPAITTSSPLPGGTQASTYNQTLAATGGTLPLAWSLLSGALPSGITLSAAGVLSGTPLADGATYTFVVQVRDNVGRTGTKTFALTIATLAAPSITTASPLPNGNVGAAYSQALAASGGYGAMAWDVSAGAVPAGTSLSAGGTLSGTPTTVEAANFTARVTDALGHVGTKAFDVTIAAPAYVYGSWAWRNNNNLPFSISGGFSEPSLTGYHAVRDKIILLRTGAGIATYQYDPAVAGDAAWSNLSQVPTGDTVWTQTTMSAWYDAVGHRLIFLLQSNYAGYYIQLWAWDGVWSRLDTSLYPRDGNASGYSSGYSVNPTGGTGGTPLLVLVNGWDNKTFRYDFGANAWSVALSGIWGGGPNGNARLCYSPALGRHIFYWSAARRTFAYNDAARTWAEIVTAHAPPAFTTDGTMVYNPEQGHVAMHPAINDGSTGRDLWTFDGVDWTDTGKICVRPGSAGFCYDSSRRRFFADIWTSAWYIDNV